MDDIQKVFKGFEKVGIDTSILVNLVVKDINLFKFKEKNFSIKNIFYYAQKTKYEFMGVLINKNGFDREEAKKSWKRVADALDLNLISTQKNKIFPYLFRVEEANNFLVKQRGNCNFQMTYKIGKADIEIIANFLKEGVCLVYTSDRAFYETCKILRLNSKIIFLPDYFKMEKRL